MSIMQMLLSTGSAAVYTFEMWGAGGGGGGPENNSATDTEHSGPGGGGAYVGGTLTGLTSGTVLELLSGAIGKVGTQGITSETNSGGGGGASAIRIQSGAVVAVAGGGAGGGAAGGNAAADATGGRGGNSVDGSGGYATDVNDTTAGIGGQSGTSTTAGTHTTTSAANPPTKTDDLQDGGQGVNRSGNTGGRANNTNPAGWGGSGGDGTTNAGNEGSGGGGGGGYFGGSGGSAATDGNNAGAGGGGGGSYTNATYVSSYSSAEGSFESGTAHSGSAPNQTAGSSATAYTTSKGKGGDGALAGGSFTDGQPGGVYIYKNGVLEASIDTSAGTATYVVDGVTSLTHVGASYERTTTDTFTQTFTPPSGAQAGDLLVLSCFQDRADATISSGPSGWTEAGTLVAHPGMGQYYQIYNGTDTSWTVTWVNDKPTSGSVVAFRPDASISLLTAEQFQSTVGNGTTEVDTISSVATTNAPGGRIYFYSSSGIENGSNLYSVSTTFSPSTDWNTVSGQGVVTNDSANYAYRLADKGDAFVSTTASGTCANRFAQAFFILNVQ